MSFKLVQTMKSWVIITRWILPLLSMLSRSRYKVPSRVSRMMLKETLNTSIIYGEPAQRVALAAPIMGIYLASAW